MEIKFFGGEHAVGYTGVEIQCCMCETYNVINKCYFNKKKKARKKKKIK